MIVHKKKSKLFLFLKAECRKCEELQIIEYHILNGFMATVINTDAF